MSDSAKTSGDLRAAPIRPTVKHGLGRGRFIDQIDRAPADWSERR